MATLGAINCLPTVGNTGNQQCFFDPAFITGAILVPKQASFDASANTGIVLTTLTANFYATSKAARWFPIYDFEKPTDNSDKLVLQSMPNGAEHPVREGYMKMMFQYFDGGLSKHLNLRLFNGSNWDFFFIDTDLQTGQQRLIGIQGSGATILQAIPTTPGGYFWANAWGLNTGTERSRYELSFQFNQRYANTKGLTQFVAVPFTFDTSLPGLLDVNLSSPSTNVTPGAFNVSVVSPLNVDLGAVNNVALAASAMWSVTNTATGLTIAITGVTWVPGVAGGNGNFVIQVNHADPNYPATGTVSVNLVAPSVLVAAGVYIESTGSIAITRN